MSLFEQKRLNSGWLQSHIACWTEGETAFVSVVFSWDLKQAYAVAVYYREKGYAVRAGGPAVVLNPSYLSDVSILGGDVKALVRHNPKATFTSRGCIRNCPFCAVPKMEGALVELDDYPVKPIICDNNLLACSMPHFDTLIDRLKAANVKGVDFNQGLDARLLTRHHADRIAELKGSLSFVRLAWDDVKLEPSFIRAWETLRAAKIPKRKIAVYILFGFKDTPEDALYRLETVKRLGSFTSPMPYQPLDALEKYSYIAPGWSRWELIQYARYWNNMKLWKIPFSDWLDGYRQSDAYVQPELTHAV